MWALWTLVDDGDAVGSGYCFGSLGCWPGVREERFKQRNPNVELVVESM